MVTRTNEVKDINTVFIYIQNLIKKLSLATVGKDIETVSASSGGEFSPDVIFFQNIFDTVHPVGEVYIQLGGMPFPQEIYNRNGIQSTWTNISDDYAGDFLRVCGGNSASTKTPYNVGSVYQNVEQPEELPNVKGYIGIMQTTYRRGTEGKGAISNTGDYGRDGETGAGRSTQTDMYLSLDKGQTNADGSYVPQADSVYKNGGHVHPVNTAVQVWRRIS